MQYTNKEDGTVTNYELDFLKNESKEIYAVVISESEGSQAEISKEMIQKAASSIFRSAGNQVVFAGKRNGHFDEYPVTVYLSKAGTEFIAEMREPSEVSVNWIDANKERAVSITSTKPNGQNPGGGSAAQKPEEGKDVQEDNAEKQDYQKPANEDQVVRKK